MGWGIDFTADIYLSKQDYGENPYSVQEEIDSLEKRNVFLKESMLMIVMGGASSVICKDCEDEDLDPVDCLHVKFNELIDCYGTNLHQLHDLYLYKEYLENKESNGNT